MLGSAWDGGRRDGSPKLSHRLPARRQRAVSNPEPERPRRRHPPAIGVSGRFWIGSAEDVLDAGDDFRVDAQGAVHAVVGPGA